MFPFIVVLIEPRIKISLQGVDRLVDFLAEGDAVTRPLQNVRSDKKNASTFKFKFRSDAGAIAWLPSGGYQTDRRGKF